MKPARSFFLLFFLGFLTCTLEGCGKKSPPKAHCPCEDISFDLPKDATQKPTNNE